MRDDGIVVELKSILRALSEHAAASDEVEAVDRITLLENIKAGCAAAQARETMRLEELRIESETAAGVPSARRCRGLAAEVALARKASGAQGARHLGFARALTREMPHTRAALASGALTEWRATVLVRETAYLTRADREEIDRRMCADVSRLAGLGDRAFDAEAKRIAYELDPEAVVNRHAAAVGDRRVSTRPAADGMVRLSALLPLKQSISVFAALKQRADAIRGRDDRTHAQIMADTLVERVTGAETAEAMPIAVNILMPSSILADDPDDPDGPDDIDDAAAQVSGYGPVPAAVARTLIADSLDAQAQVSLRRLFVTPEAGALVAMDSRARCFPTGLRTLLDLRDEHCRIPYCDAPIEEFDHADPHANGGATSEANGLGMCRSHNRAKQNAGWDVVATPGDDDVGRHTAVIVTPTDHVHTSTAPPPPGFHDPVTVLVKRRLDALFAA